MRKIYFPGDLVCDGPVPGMLYVRSGSCKILSHRKFDSKKQSEDDSDDDGGRTVGGKANASEKLTNIKGVLRREGTIEGTKGTEGFGEGTLKFEAMLFGEKVQ